MHLSPGERESLGELETRLSRSAPRLAAMLTYGTTTCTRRSSARMYLRSCWADRSELVRFLIVAVCLAVCVGLAVDGVLTTHPASSPGHSVGRSGPGQPAGGVWPDIAPGSHP